MSNEQEWMEFVRACAVDAINGELASKDIENGARDFGKERNFFVALKSECLKLDPTTGPNQEFHLQLVAFGRIFDETR